MTRTSSNRNSTSNRNNLIKFSIAIAAILAIAYIENDTQRKEFEYCAKTHDVTMCAGIKSLPHPEAPVLKNAEKPIWGSGLGE